MRLAALDVHRVWQRVLTLDHGAPAGELLLKERPRKL